MSAFPGLVRRTALASMLIACAAGRLRAVTVHAGGVSVDLPDGWSAVEPPAGAAAAWRLPAGTGVAASLVVEVHPRATAVRRDLLPAEERAIERPIHGSPGLRLLAHGVVEVDGLPAYRLRGRTEVEGRAVEQLQFIISGPRTVLLTFSWEEGGGSEKDFDPLARSARVGQGAGSPAGGEGGDLAMVLGLLAGAALASRRLVRR
jgi:hypothetical protein